ncbi:hypothetical protein UO65_3150 [Actinokineospora spheciospongiae]|uniref:Uncharacterized protein n=1 Tax=Actinokineospora spheciospongiae TaxID=909613 RepID=W7IXH2_9PSEU|nr:hypothetical protein UO65_3150 [Actinokineospora spheciospongiae]PWW51500.1 hypothetical protein DFQ13_12047 [Actinokineospora spheciospongiae]
MPHLRAVVPSAAAACPPAAPAAGGSPDRVVVSQHGSKA